MQPDMQMAPNEQLTIHTQPGSQRQQTVDSGRQEEMDVVDISMSKNGMFNNPGSQMSGGHNNIQDLVVKNKMSTVRMSGTSVLYDGPVANVEQNQISVEL